ncbi:hypothetical protein NZD88_21050 [Chryseobacterium antibioticum]|uniref:Uncharacterized protein n=1 Tax=Chryseobacterium pyrolae TaxID=2987481 RepID=A0ABT2IMZ9_9FLAO|nr:hypothetical protein [Chryseobacterium pyrolae]MCT2410052.1 hypothetical protein [Chryseobacterium pyrolae]
MKHYGKYLPWAGSPVKYKSDDIERLLVKEERLKNDLLKLQSEIKIAEIDFEKMIKEDWTEDEIKEAKEKARIL